MAAVEQSVNLTSLEGETFEVSLEVVKLSEVVKIMVDQGGKPLHTILHIDTDAHRFSNKSSAFALTLTLAAPPQTTMRRMPRIFPCPWSSQRSW